MTDSIVQELTNDNYPFDPVRNLYSLKKYLQNCNGYNIMYGTNCYSGKYHENYKNIIIDYEEPNGLDFSSVLTSSKINDVKSLHKKLTLCPYSAKLFNSVTKLDNVEPCFFMVDNEYLVDSLGYPDFNNKSFDVLYVGHDHSNLTGDFKKFNPPNLTIPTYIDKIKALYNSKIAICHNVLFYDYNNKNYLDITRFFPELENDKHEIPQLKSRIFESGFSKCIPLVYFDKSKIIENFFEPDVDFIYFHTIDELKTLVNKILDNYDFYKFIAENIYKKCNDKYKISDFVNKYIL